MSSERVAVVGGGMSGIAAAHFLAKAGLEPEIIEAGSALGGRAGSVRLGDRVVDIGGKNIGRKYTLFRQFIADHGAPPLEFFGINSSMIRDGVLHTLDSQHKVASLFHVLRLVGARDFVRLMRLARRVQRDPREALLGAPGFSELSERYDHLPLSAWFGAPAVDAFLRPITLRMNGAEPDEYYLGCLGSNLKMLLDKYDQLTFGMAELLERFQDTVATRLGTTVQRVEPLGNGRCRLLLEQSDGARAWGDYAHVIVALPAPQAAAALAEQSICESLAKVSYHPVTLIVARYGRPIFSPAVRAIVFDAESALSNAGSYGKDDLNVVRYTLSGREARRIAPGVSPADVLGLAEQMLNRYVPVSAEDRRDFVYRRFERGLCAYAPFHHRLLDAMRRWEDSVGAVTLTGDYVCGASIEACFEAGRASAERAAQRLGDPRSAARPLGAKAPKQEASSAPRNFRTMTQEAP